MTLHYWPGLFRHDSHLAHSSDVHASSLAAIRIHEEANRLHPSAGSPTAPEAVPGHADILLIYQHRGRSGPGCDWLAPGQSWANLQFTIGSARTAGTSSSRVLRRSGTLLIKPAAVAVLPKTNVFAVWTAAPLALGEHPLDRSGPHPRVGAFHVNSTPNRLGPSQLRGGPGNP